VGGWGAWVGGGPGGLGEGVGGFFTVAGMVWGGIDDVTEALLGPEGKGVEAARLLLIEVAEVALEVMASIIEVATDLLEACAEGVIVVGFEELVDGPE